MDYCLYSNVDAYVVGKLNKNFPEDLAGIIQGFRNRY